MRITDLTHTIHPGMPVFPGTEEPVFEGANTIEKDGFRETKITMYSHTGTHMDAPAHMLKNGLFLDDLDVGDFIGDAVILDFSDRKFDLIGIDDVKPFEEKIKNTRFVVIKTGWSRYWGQKKYYEDFPSLSLEAARWLAKPNIKGIGIDTISIDDMNSTDFAVHKEFLTKNILIIENLTNLEAVEKEHFILSVMPIKTSKADGSPVRAVAIED